MPSYSSFHLSLWAYLAGYTTTTHTIKPLEDSGSGFSLEFALLIQAHTAQNTFSPYPLLTSDWIIYDIARYLPLNIILFWIIIVAPRRQFTIKRHLTHKGNLTFWGDFKFISTVVPRKGLPFSRGGVIAGRSSSIMGYGRKNKGRKGKAECLPCQWAAFRRNVYLLISKQLLHMCYCDCVTHESNSTFCQQANSAVPITELLSLRFFFFHGESTLIST